MKHLDLFSGIGGFALGLNRAGFKTIAFCEVDPFCQKVLRKHWPEVPIIRDVRDAKEFESIGSVDIITGGFPCQPWSQAGHRKGEKDSRHLWPEMFERIKQLRPTWVIGENVAGIVSVGLDQVLSDLESEDYQCRTFAIPAVAIGAPHRRERIWIVAHSKRDRNVWRDRELETVASNDQPRRGKENGGGQWWQTEPGLDRVVDGIPNRLDRLGSLGNAVVPKIPEIIGRAIMNVQ